MSKLDLNKVKLGVSPLDPDKIYMFRHGKEPNIALDKRDVTQDIYAALVGRLKGAKEHITELKEIGIGRRFVISVKEVTNES